jgi:hypothetical protein
MHPARDTGRGRVSYAATRGYRQLPRAVHHLLQGALQLGALRSLPGLPSLRSMSHLRNSAYGLDARWALRHRAVRVWFYDALGDVGRRQVRSRPRAGGALDRRLLHCRLPCMRSLERTTPRHLAPQTPRRTRCRVQWRRRSRLGRS